MNAQTTRAIQVILLKGKKKGRKERNGEIIARKTV